MYQSSLLSSDSDFTGPVDAAFFSQYDGEGREAAGLGGAAEKHVEMDELVAKEQAQLDADAQVPLPGGVQTELNAGDGVVYITPILHWGSNYSTKLRRTLHGGYSNFAPYRDLGFAEHLSAEGRALFEQLRAYRRELAQRQGVPPYVIFHDATLTALARTRPRSLEEMASISGVGEVKLARYGEAFVTKIAAFEEDTS